MRAPAFPFLLLALAAATPAGAQQIALKPLVDARLRYEHDEQDGLLDASDAATIRIRAGVQASVARWSALVEAQGNLAVVGGYYDGLHGAATRPLISDPESVAIYRAQFAYKAPGIAVTAGRQRIALDDERFVGASNFRQNGQTFDAVRGEWSAINGLRADVSYVRNVRTIWGADGGGARPRAVPGDTLLANLAAATPIGTLTGFAYLIDQDRASLSGYRLSSQTYGGRLSGSRPLGHGVKLSYALSVARQSDYARNPNRYAARYYLVDAGLDAHALHLGGGYEVLGASGGAALTSVQTPLGTNFKFQGWADRFLTTPPDGVRDLYGTAGYGWKSWGALKAVSLSATVHRFESDRLVRHYGDELDALASARLARTTVSLRYADYRADRFATDTRKFWLQLDWSV